MDPLKISILIHIDKIKPSNVDNIGRTLHLQYLSLLVEKLELPKDRTSDVQLQ